MGDGRSVVLTCLKRCVWPGGDRCELLVLTRLIKVGRWVGRQDLESSTSQGLEITDGGGAEPKAAASWVGA